VSGPGTEVETPQNEAEGRARPSLLASAVMTYATNLSVAMLSLINVLIIARSLGATGRGDVAFLITVATMTGMLAGLSIQEANGNLAGTDPPLRRALATNSLLFSVVLGAIAAVVLVAIIGVFPSVGGQVSRELLYVTLGSLPLVIIRVYLSFLCQADYAFAITNAAWLSGPTTTFLTNGTLALLGWLSVGTAIGAWIAGQALGAVLLIVYVARHTGFGRPHLPTARRQFGFGIKVHLSRFLSVGNYRADQWFVGAIAGSRELGVYSVAVAWAEALFYLPGVLVLIQRPDLVRAGRGEAVSYASRMMRVALVLAGLMAVGLIVLAPILCVTIFGEEFAGSVAQLRVLALAAPGIVAVELLSGALIAQRRPLHASAAVAVAFVLTVVLNPILISWHGGLGAAIARTLAYSAGGAAAALMFTAVLGGRRRDLLPRGTEIPWFYGKLRARFSRA
jgi:O-antigen/teichoic acid export membrane protein